MLARLCQPNAVLVWVGEFLLCPGIQCCERTPPKKSRPSWGSLGVSRISLFLRTRWSRNKREFRMLWGYKCSTSILYPPWPVSRLSKPQWRQVTHARMVTNHPNPAVSWDKHGANDKHCHISHTYLNKILYMFINQGETFDQNRRWWK